MTDYGIDIDSRFTFQDGDLLLTNNEDTLIQAITNRLKTQLDELDLFYSDYGSILHDFLGWRRNDDTVQLVKLEIESCLDRESRIDGYETEISLIEKGFDIAIFIYEEDSSEAIELEYLLSTDGLILAE